MSPHQLRRGYVCGRVGERASRACIVTDLIGVAEATADWAGDLDVRLKLRTVRADTIHIFGSIELTIDNFGVDQVRQMVSVHPGFDAHAVSHALPKLELERSNLLRSQIWICQIHSRCDFPFNRTGCAEGFAVEKLERGCIARLDNYRKPRRKSRSEALSCIDPGTARESQSAPKLNFVIGERGHGREGA